MILWFAWMQAVRSLRPACRRSRTFLWMVLALMGLCCRSDRAGVTSYVRVLDFGSDAYHRFLHLFHSKGLDLDRLTACWVQLCLMLFQPMLAGSRIVCLADGIKAPKEGKQMPAVKMLHQQSASNSKPEFIMGHSFQAISLLVQGASGHVAAVPPTYRAGFWSSPTAIPEPCSISWWRCCSRSPMSWSARFCLWPMPTMQAGSSSRSFSQTGTSS
jgi:hypothetical protein